MGMPWIHSDSDDQIFEGIEDGYRSHHFKPLALSSDSTQVNRNGDYDNMELALPLTFNQIGKFNEEWFWVFGYGTTAVLVIIANTMMLCSIIKNAFLHTNTHR